MSAAGARRRGRARRATAPGFGRELATRLWPTLLGALATAAVLWYIGSLPHSIPEVVLVALLGGAAGALITWALSRTGQHVERAYWVSTPRQEAVPPAALDYRLLRLRRDLRDAIERDDRPDEIHPVLVDLASERLRSLHGLDLATEPERAEQAMDPALWTYLTHPPTDTRRRSKGALQTAIEGIEKL